MGAMRVGKVGRNISLVGLDFPQQFLNRNNITLRHRQFLYPATLVERQVEEVDMLAVDAVVLTCQPCLATTDKSLQAQYLLRLSVSLFLVLDEVLHPLITLLYHLVGAVGEYCVKAVDEVHETTHLLVTHSDVA